MNSIRLDKRIRNRVNFIEFSLKKTNEATLQGGGVVGGAWGGWKKGEVGGGRWWGVVGWKKGKGMLEFAYQLIKNTNR